MFIINLLFSPSERARKNAETLIYLCYSHLGLAALPPSLIAVSSLLTALRPALDTLPLTLLRDTPSPSSTSSASSLTSSPPSAAAAAVPSTSSAAQPPAMDADPLGGVMAALERLSLGEATQVRQCMNRLEELMHASLPPSPAGSEDDEDSSPVVAGAGGSRRSYYAAVAATAAAAASSTPVVAASAAGSRSLFAATARARLIEEAAQADQSF